MLDYKRSANGGPFGVKYCGVWLGCASFELGRLTETELETMALAARYSSNAFPYSLDELEAEYFRRLKLEA